MRCAHGSAVPVESVVTGDVLAALCPDCGVQLSAEFLTCPHDNVIDTPSLNQRPGLGICNDCGTSASFDRPRAVVTFDSNVSFENIEALKARFLAAQREPHRTLFLPTVASFDAPTRAEIDG